jgi:hypothetical protein
MKNHKNYANPYEVAMYKLLQRIKREEMIELFANQIRLTPFTGEDGLTYIELGCKMN